MTRQRAKGRDLDGIVLLDKPVGLSSNDALQRAKRLFGARKAGHTGSLDRLASGLLPICLGEATKISGVLLNADKHYLATFRLGERTTTGDAEGEVLEQRPLEGVTRQSVEAALARGGDETAWPHLVAYRQRMRARPAYQRALEQGGPVVMQA